MPESDLADLNQTLKDFRPFIAQFTHTTNLVSLFNMVCAQFRTAKQETNAENESLVKALPALERIVTQATDSLRRPGTPPSPGITALFDPGEEAEQQMYITFAKGRIYLVTAQAPTEDLNNAAVVRMRQLVAETKAEVPGLNVGLTGEPVLELDEMAQSQKDTTLASVVSLVLCALIFIYGYQETGRPVKATLCLIVGLGYTLAFATLAIGHLNILTITFVPILIGLAIDYGVHLISRYEEELRRGKSEEAALTKAMVLHRAGHFHAAASPPPAAFLAMGLTNFKGIQEMGIICGGGLLVCLVPMMTMLPVLLLRGRQNVVDHEQGDAGGEAGAHREPLAAAAGLDRRPDGGAVRAWRRRRSTRSISITTCSTCRAKACRRWSLRRTSSRHSTPQAIAKSSVRAPSLPPTLQQAVALEQQLTNLPAVASVDP